MFGRVAGGGFVRAGLVAALLCLGAPRTGAQELTPRAHWPAPRGTQVLIVGYSHVAGHVLFDPATPLYGVESRIRTAVLGYLRTVNLFGRTTNVSVDYYDRAPFELNGTVDRVHVRYLEWGLGEDFVRSRPSVNDGCIGRFSRAALGRGSEWTDARPGFGGELRGHGSTKGTLQRGESPHRPQQNP